MIEDVEVLILGAGLTGLAAASSLGRRAIVLERDRRPGGLVRTERFGDYWFDHVVHLLYFPDPPTASRVRAIVGEDLKPCIPLAWVECEAGTVRFPFQMHLGGLPPQVVARCVRDLAEVTFGPRPATPDNFEDMLLSSFGRGMCETFLLPYNRKMWKRPLASLATGGFTWNIARPDFDAVLKGALSPADGFEAYNSQGWYPRPPTDAPVRGMEVLAQALAAQAADLRLECKVEQVDLERRLVTARRGRTRTTLHYDAACLSTLPLPSLLRLCHPVPSDLRAAVEGLTHNRVVSVALSIRGPRPRGRGHWRYYSDESLCFTRLIYLHEFDPALAPADGWGLLVEITEPAELPMQEHAALLARVRADVQAAGALPDDCRIVDEHVMPVDPAYVVFPRRGRDAVEEARQFLARHGICSLGRYGAWEYSSMGQVMRDGFAWADRIGQGLPQQDALALEER